MAKSMNTQLCGYKLCTETSKSQPPGGGKGTIDEATSNKQAFGPHHNKTKSVESMLKQVVEVKNNSI